MAAVLKASEATPAQEKQLWEAFNKFDANGDGKIQADEFKKLMGSLGEFSSKEIKRLFKEADSDGSGGVDWREFLAWICSGKALLGMGEAAAASFERLLNNETMDEASFVQSAKMGHDVTDYLKKEKEEGKERKKRTRKKSVRDNCDAMGVPENWEGLRLTPPMTFDQANLVLNHYLQNGEKSPLHPRQAQYIVDEFAQAYRDRHPNPVVHTECPGPDGRLIVVGDTHGQLADVLHILFHHGPPTAQNRYLFNGDMVDRGPQGVEILLILFSFFLADKESVILHRGNHENEDMNALDIDNGGGFADEVIDRKYGLHLYRDFVAAFKALSLCSVINKEIFVVHGGLTRVKNLSIDYINGIDFHECTAPNPMSTNVKDQIFSDLIWSDPTDHDGKFKSERGVGIKYGPDVTTKFCSQNRLRFMIRSHQVPEDGRGFYKQHADRCVTVFSASNYCGDGGNYGAVIVLAAKTFPRYDMFEHFAAPLEEMPNVVAMMQKTAGNEAETDKDWIEVSTAKQKESQEASKSGRQEKEMLRMITKVIEKKPQLWSYLIANNVGTSKLELVQWAKIMEEHIEGGHPWQEVADLLGLKDAEGKIQMTDFLNRWVVKIESESFSSFVNDAIKMVYEAIVAMDMDLAETFKMFDKDGDGVVDLKEAKEVLGKYDLGLSPEQIDRLLGQLFSVAVTDSKTADVKLPVEAFLGRFAMVYSATNNNADMPSWAMDMLQKIGRLIVKGARSGSRPGTPTQDTEIATDVTKLSELFSKIDTSGDGTLQLDEFIAGIETLPGLFDLAVEGEKLTHEKLLELSKCLDVTGDGTINYMEFLQAFQLQGQGSSDLENSLVEDVTTILFRQRVAIRTGCRYLDEVDSGKVPPEEFLSVLHGVNNALAKSPENGRCLTESQLQHLTKAMVVEDTEGEKGSFIHYEQFLKSFVIIDTQTGKPIKSF